MIDFSLIHCVVYQLDEMEEGEFDADDMEDAVR